MLKLDDKVKIIKIHVKANFNDKENVETKLNNWIKQNPIVYIKYDESNGKSLFPYFFQYNKLSNIKINDIEYQISNILKNDSIDKLEIIKIDLLDEIEKNKHIMDQINKLNDEIHKLQDEFQNHYLEIPTSGVRYYNKEHPFFKKS